jgi:hypothetical protein
MPDEKQPEHLDVISTMIDTADYDPNQGTLDISFNNGRTYTLDNVTADVWEAFKQAPSKGRFFNQFLKGQF